MRPSFLGKISRLSRVFLGLNSRPGGSHLDVRAGNQKRPLGLEGSAPPPGPALPKPPVSATGSKALALGHTQMIDLVH